MSKKIRMPVVGTMYITKESPYYYATVMSVEMNLVTYRLGALNMESTQKCTTAEFNKKYTSMLLDTHESDTRVGVLHFNGEKCFARVTIVVYGVVHYTLHTSPGSQSIGERFLTEYEFAKQYSVYDPTISTPKLGDTVKVKKDIPILNSSKMHKVSDTEFYNKYTRDILGFCGTMVKVNVYRVLDAFLVHNPQLQHLVKKALCVGQRGHKSTTQDYKDILDSAQSAYDMQLQKEQLEK